MSNFNVRSTFAKGGRNMENQGCVSFMFQQKGKLVIKKDSRDEDEMMMMMMMALDAGAEDFNSDEDEVYVITTTPEDFGAVREKLEE